jgi:Nitroreductase family
MLATMSAIPHSEHFQSLLVDSSFHIFYHAPVLILISASAEGPWIIEDCALAAENLMLSAYAAGLGACWIGFAQSFLNTSEGKNMLGLPAASVPVSADHCRTSKIRGPACAAQRAEGSLGRLNRFFEANLRWINATGLRSIRIKCLLTLEV